MTTFVSVGNAVQPFGRLIDGVVAICEQLPGPLVIQHGHTPVEPCEGVETVPFLDMDSFAAHVSSAELLILHAGAGSLIHAIQAGKVPVVMPRRAVYHEHVDDHQVELSQALERERRVVVALEPDALPAAVEQALMLQRALAQQPTEQPAIVHMVESLLDALAASA